MMAAQKALNILGNKLANERTKRKHMQNEQVKIKTQLQQKETDIAKLKDEMVNIKNKSMTTEERLNELNKIYEVGICSLKNTILVIIQVSYSFYFRIKKL